jgi:hypothetical protein
VTAQRNVLLGRTDSVGRTELSCLKLFAEYAVHSQPLRQTLHACEQICINIQYLIQHIVQLLINKNMSVLFLHVSTSIRSSSGRNIQRNTSTSNFVKDVRVCVCVCVCVCM